MRRPQLTLPPDQTLAMLVDAEVVHLATIGAAGQPVTRALHAVVQDGALWFHGSPRGEKADAAGGPAVVSVEEALCTIPSHWTDPERACPATTWYRSAQAKGRLTRCDEPATKAAVLAALMKKYQPEGGYRPLDEADPLYRAVVQGIGIWRVPLDELSGKQKLAQNKSDADRARILDGLWSRGAPGDLRAIELCLQSEPTRPVPPRFDLGEGRRLSVQASEADLEAALALVKDEYWNDQVDDATVLAAHRGSTAWVGARAADGRVIATARAVSDGAKLGWIYDVAVAASQRGRGLGSRVMGLLLDHPGLRSTWKVSLATVDAAPFYRRLGFTERALRPGSVELTLRRAG